MAPENLGQSIDERYALMAGFDNSEDTVLTTWPLNDWWGRESEFLDFAAGFPRRLVAMVHTGTDDDANTTNIELQLHWSISEDDPRFPAPDVAARILAEERALNVAKLGAVNNERPPGSSQVI